MLSSIPRFLANMPPISWQVGGRPWQKSMIYPLDTANFRVFDRVNPQSNGFNTQPDF